MADAAIFVGWGQPARARERQALQVFRRATGYCGRLQEEGRLESFEFVLIQPHGGDLHGFVMLRGTRRDLDAIRSEDEFVRLSARASLVVDDFGVVDAYVGEGLARRLEVFGEQAEEQLRA